MGEEIKEKILEFLKENSGQDFSISKLKERVGFSYPTILKWIVVLQSEEKIRLKDYGNIKIVSFKNDILPYPKG